MAETYQRSKFIGVDAYPVFPQHIKPPNAHFELCNIAKRMPFEDNTFDYIHQRLVFFGLTNTDWDNVKEKEISQTSTHFFFQTGSGRIVSYNQTWGLRRAY